MKHITIVQTACLCLLQIHYDVGSSLSCDNWQNQCSKMFSQSNSVDIEYR